MTVTATTPERAIVQKRTVKVLAASVIPAGMGTAGAWAATGVLAKDITGSETLAGLAAASGNLGGVIITLPLAAYMARAGRRPGLRLGWLIAATGAFLGFLAAILEFYPLLAVAMLAIGAGNATNLAARYAASDLALDEHRARAISYLVWAGTIGSVLGPTLALGPAGWIVKQFGLPELSGPYLLGMIVFSAAGISIDRMLRPDPLVLSGRISSRTEKRPPVSRAFKTIWSYPAARLAVFGMAVGQAVMVGVMVMTPLHMKDGNHELRIIGFVISVHIMGMFAFSPLVGWMVDRIGPHLMIAGGGLILFTGAEMASHTDASDSGGVFLGLFLIGLGWSFGLIAGSSLLTGTIPLESRVAVQGAADLLMVAAGAAAGITSGIAIEWSSFHALSHWSGVMALSMVATAGWAIVTHRTARPAI